MPLSKKKRIAISIAGGCGSAIILAMLYLFLWGPLSPFSPCLPGFHCKDTNKARIYYHDGADISALNGIDAIVTAVEEAHGLKFPGKAQFIVCASDAEYRRRASTGSRFCVFPGYGRLLISRRGLDDGVNHTIHLDVYLAHEVSHSLLYSTTGLWSSLRFPDWALEGVAVYTSNQRGVDGYLTKDEVRDKIQQGYFLSPSDFWTKPWKSTKALKEFPLENKYWFVYSELACFVEYLIETGGRDKFWTYLDGLRKGKDAEESFMALYGKPFDVVVKAFRDAMK